MVEPAGALSGRAYALALAALPGVGPATLRALLDRPAPEAWSEVLAGTHPADPAGSLRVHAAQRDVAALWRAHQSAGVTVRMLGEAGYPAALAGDPQAPAVVLARGDLGRLDRRPAVAVIGTRSATRYGRGVAAELGAALAASGVHVVSGLALGIDGAAHEGALATAEGGPVPSAPAAPGLPIGVVAGGLDVPYPARHARLWERVAAAGVLLSEAPLGVSHQRWRFPRRNRLLAALADVVVVVECHVAGGSMLTVDAATALGVPVGVVPGSVRSPASAGTNQLLVDGAFPVRDVDDVLVALSLARPVPPIGMRPARPAARRARAGGAPDRTPASVEAAGAKPGRNEPGRGEPSGAGPGREVTAEEAEESAVLAAVEWEPVAFEQVLVRSGLPVGRAADVLAVLAARGVVSGSGGWWVRR